MESVQPIEIDVFLQRPIPVNLIDEEGKIETINLPRLGVDGLLPWLAEISAERKAQFRASYKDLKLDKRQLADAEFSAEVNTKAVISDLNVPAQTPEGVRRILSLSLAKTLLMPERQSAALEQILASGYVAYGLATRLSSLFATGERRPPKPDPAQAAAKMFPGINPSGDAGPLADGESGQNSTDPASLTTGSAST